MGSVDKGRREGLELCFGDKSNRTMTDLGVAVDRGGEVTFPLHSAKYTL